VNGWSITVPKNLMVTFPAAFVPWKDFVANKDVVTGYEVNVRSSSRPKIVFMLMEHSARLWATLSVANPSRPRSPWLSLLSSSTRGTSTRSTSTAPCRFEMVQSFASTTPMPCFQPASRHRFLSLMTRVPVSLHSLGSLCVCLVPSMILFVPRAIDHWWQVQTVRKGSCK
jgi:hypothetical protein